MERFGGERGPEDSIERRAEGLSLEINRLLSLLIESGPELDPYYKKQLRNYLHQILGIFDLEEKGAEGLLEVRRRMDRSFDKLPVSTYYPSIQEFQQGLLGVVMSSESSDLPLMPREVSATQLAKNAQHDWLSIDGGDSRYTLDYLYELGKVMVSRPAYEALFPETDNITVYDDWQIENGPQRALILRTLGSSFVAEKGMDAWIKVDNLESNLDS